jgi:hypothetical protein
MLTVVQEEWEVMKNTNTLHTLRIGTLLSVRYLIVGFSLSFKVGISVM